MPRCYGCECVIRVKEIFIMSPKTASAALVGNKIEYEIPRKLLFLPYMIIPVIAVIVFIDQIFLGRFIQSYSLTATQTLIILALFLNIPHIAASTITFFDAEYLRRYGLRIFIPAFLLGFILFLFPAVIYSNIYLMIYIVWNMLHQVGQGFGQCRLFGVGFEKTHSLWKWSAVLVAVAIYVGTTGIYKISSDMNHVIIVVMWALIVPFCVFSYLVYKPAASLQARLFVLANIATVILSAVLYSLHYPFFCILLGRVVHDVSAFIFFMT